MINQAACDGSSDSTGWKLTDGKLQAPGGAEPQCLDGSSPQPPAAGQSTSGMVSCPPPTTKCGSSLCPGCGSLLTNCSTASGTTGAQRIHRRSDVEPRRGVRRWRQPARAAKVAGQVPECSAICRRG